MNKPTVAKTRDFVRKHKTVLAATVGVAAGASITYYTTIHSRTLLEVTAQHVDHMREHGGAFLYETEFGNLMLSYVPTHG